MWKPLCLLLISILLFFCSGSPEQPVINPLMVFEVDAGDQDRVDALVSTMVSPPAHEGRLCLVEVSEGRRLPVPFQVDPGPPSRLFWVLEDESPRGTTRTYHLVPCDAGAPAGELELIDEKGQWLGVTWGSEKVLQYNYGTVQPPPEVSQQQARSGYLHPVWTPAGKIVTDDFHPGHLHQRGIWFAWTETRYEDREPDFWNLGEGTGTVRFKAFEDRYAGPLFAGFRAVHEHVDLSAPQGEEVILQETWSVRAYELGGSRRGYFLIDIDSVQTGTGDSPLILEEYHYGGFAFRGAREWGPDTVRFETASGKDRIAGDGSREDWCLIEGPLDGGAAGAVVFSHPGNTRAPQPLRIHPEMPYFAFAPVRLGSLQIDRGENLVSRYRILVYDGSPPKSLVDSFWKDFSEPPTVRVIE